MQQSTFFVSCRRYIHYRRRFLFPAMIGLVLLFAGCNATDESKDIDFVEPPDGWTDGCDWGYEGGAKAAQDDCLPPDPGNNDNYAMLADIVEAYDGFYINQAGQTIELTCQSAGYWAIPAQTMPDNVACAYSWEVPFHGVNHDTGETYLSGVSQSYPNLQNNAGIMVWSEKTEELFYGGRQGDLGEGWYWQFDDKDKRWYKQ